MARRGDVSSYMALLDTCPISGTKDRPSFGTWISTFAPSSRPPFPPKSQPTERQPARMGGGRWPDVPSPPATSPSPCRGGGLAWSEAREGANMKKGHEDERGRRILLTLVVLGVVAAIVGVGSLSAFSSQTSNSGNTFDAGTVYLSDNDAGSAMYTVSNQKPGGSAVVRCIKVTYGGSLAADVHLYTTSTVNAVGQYINLSVEKGTSAGSPA